MSMEEPETMVAEPEEEEGEFEEGPDGLHPSSLHQPTPYTLQQVLNIVLWFITSYGWLTVGVLVAVIYLRRKYGRRWEDWQSRREEYQERGAHHKDPDKFLSRERALDAARLRMQEKYNAVAREDAEKRRQKEEEEKQRQAQERSKPKQASSEKPRLRPEYFPLMSETRSGTCGWRPGRRGGAGGG